MRQHACVIKKLAGIGSALGHVFQPDHEKLERLPMIAREQFAQMLHQPSC